MLLTQNITVPIDTSTGLATIVPSQLIINASDNCGINPTSISISQNIFNCSNLGLNPVTVTVSDVNGNTVQRTAVVTIVGAQIGENLIVGEMQVCKNAYNVKYSIQGYRTSSVYVWDFDPAKAKVISTSFKGREVYVQWIGIAGPTTIEVSELNLSNCGTVISDTIVSISGAAPDTSVIKYWNEATKTTLVSTDTVSSYFQWGYDVFVGTLLVSNVLPDETSNSYYNVDIGSNIANLGYKYWCETSFDGQCWNRSYFSNYPVNIEEWGIHQTQLWPNPTQENLSISSDENMIEIAISDMFGRIISVKEIEKTTSYLLDDFAVLPASNYILTIKYASQSGI